MVEKNIAQLGKMIRELRTTNDIKSVEFAKDIGVSQSYISDLENGKKETANGNIRKNCKLLWWH